MSTITRNPVAAATKVKVEKAIAASAVQQFAAMKSAFDQCDPEIQEVISDMISIVTDDSKSADDRLHAADVILEAMFPCVGADALQLEELESESDEGQRAAREIDDEEAAFADRVTSLMEQKGLSQSALAEMIGLKQPAVSNMLKRRNRPQRRTVKNIANALGVKPEELWPGFED